MAYQKAATAVTYNDLEGHSPVAGLSKCNPSNICAVVYTISTECAHSTSMLEKLLLWATFSFFSTEPAEPLSFIECNINQVCATGCNGQSHSVLLMTII